MTEGEFQRTNAGFHRGAQVASRLPQWKGVLAQARQVERLQTDVEHMPLLALHVTHLQSGFGIRTLFTFRLSKNKLITSGARSGLHQQFNAMLALGSNQLFSFIKLPVQFVKRNVRFAGRIATNGTEVWGDVIVLQGLQAVWGVIAAVQVNAFHTRSLHEIVQAFRSDKSSIIAVGAGNVNGRNQLHFVFRGIGFAQVDADAFHRLLTFLATGSLRVMWRLDVSRFQF